MNYSHKIVKKSIPASGPADIGGVTGGFLLPGNARSDDLGGIWQGVAGGKCIAGKVAEGGQAIQHSNCFPASSTQNSFLNLYLRGASSA